MKTKTLTSIVRAAALAMLASCGGIAYKTKTDCAVAKIEDRVFSPDDDICIIPFPTPPRMPSGEGPAASEVLLAEYQRYHKETIHYRQSLEKFSNIHPDVDLEVTINAAEALEKQAVYLAQQQEKKHLEESSDFLKKTYGEIFDQIKKWVHDWSGELSFNPTLTFNPVLKFEPKMNASPVFKDYAPVPEQNPQQPQKDTPKETSYNLPNAIRVASGWVNAQYSQNHLSREQQRKICNHEKLDDIKVEYLGKIEFPECGFDVPEHPILQELVGRAKDNSLVGKTMLFCGNADKYLAEKCPSKKNQDLSGHRAINGMNTLVERVGESTLAPTHADVYPNGTTLDQRSLEVYVIGGTKNES